MYSFLAKANVEALEYNSRIMYVHDIIEIATSLEKKSDPHEVAGGLLHCGLSGDFNNLFHVRLFWAQLQISVAYFCSIGLYFLV